MARARKRSFGRHPAMDTRDLVIKYRRTARTRRMWNEGRWSGDQGFTPHCVGYAWAHWLTAYPVRNWLDPDGIYTQALYCDEWEGEDYEGTSVRAGAKVLHHLRMIERYEFAWQIDSVIYALMERGPVVLGVNWYSGMDEPDDEGIIRATGDILGGHAILASGVDTRQGLIRLKNSWGLSWGLGGHCFLPIEDATQLLSEEGEACLATEIESKIPK